MKFILHITAVVTLVLGGSVLPSHAAAPDAEESEFRTKAKSVFTALTREFQNFKADTPLSPDQKTQIHTVLKTHRSEIRALMVEFRAARRAMADAARTDPGSSDSLAAADKIGELARTRALLVAKIGAEVRPLLTPEQIKNLDLARGKVESAVDEAL